MKSCILVGAGELNMEEIPVEKEDFLIAVDGGMDYCIKLRIHPDLIVGDFDSLGQEGWEKIRFLAQRKKEIVLQLPCEKDDTDMLFALKEGIKRGYRNFILYGALGGRLDHTIANIQSLLFLKEQGANGKIVDRTMEIEMIHNGTRVYEKECEGMLSVFSMEERSEGVNIIGMKYPLTEAVVTSSFPIGISNEFMNQNASVTVKNGTLLLIHQKSDKRICQIKQ